MSVETGCRSLCACAHQDRGDHDLAGAHLGDSLATLDDTAISALRAERVGFAFQFASLIPTLNALDNVRLPSLFADGSVSPKEAVHLLSWVGLSDKIKNFPSQLSGGQRARVALARSFANHPELLLADEPTGNLDVETENEVMGLFKAINQNEGITSGELSVVGFAPDDMSSTGWRRKPLPLTQPLPKGRGVGFTLYDSRLRKFTPHTFP